MSLSRTSTRDGGYLFPPQSDLEPIDSAPSYMQATGRERATHTFTSQPFASNSTLSLQIKSMATNPSSAPLFFDGAVIEGRVLLDLTKKLNIREILVKVRGRATSMYQSPGPHVPEMTFLKLDAPIWPPAPSPSSSSATSFRAYPLAPTTGTQAWPFTFAVPPAFTFQGKQYPLPPTYADKAYITYMIHVILKRDLLHSDISVSTTFRYIPRSRPGETSDAYARAILEGSPIPGPRLDPSGWNLLTFVMTGRLFKERDVSVFCQLALPTPPEYTHGTTIPIYISVAGQDEQAVALLLSPQSWQICLAKHTILSSNSSASGSTVSIVLAGADRISNMTDVVSAGRIWRADEEDIRSGFAIRAEVVIPRGTTPSFAFPYITVSYALRILPVASGLKLRSSSPVEFGVTVTSSSSRSMIAGLVAGSVPSNLSRVPTYDDAAPK